MPAPDAQIKFTLKVLFGPMFGCELHLPADDYFLIINPGLALQNTAEPVTAEKHAATYTQNTLYLPCDIPSPNIILHLAEWRDNEDTGAGYQLEIQDPDNSYSASLKEKDVFVHEHIRFAVKQSHDEWPEHIKNFNLPPAVAPEPDKTETLEEFTTRKKRALIMGSVFLVVLLITTAFIWYKKLENDRQVLTLNDALAGSPAPLNIIRGRDNHAIYVLTTEHRALEWVQEALFKLQENNSTIPVWLPLERKNVIDQLTKIGYPVLQIDYSSPQHPVISLYQKLTPQEENAFRSAVMQKIPFALDIRTLIKTKSQLLDEARQGLDRLHIYYRQITTSSGYALIVRDSLSDNTLTAAQHFIENFSQQWGSEIINFSINLNENWLQNKSYLDAPNGYLFLNPRHWYFPLNKEL